VYTCMRVFIYAATCISTTGKYAENKDFVLSLSESKSFK